LGSAGGREGGVAGFERVPRGRGVVGLLEQVRVDRERDARVHGPGCRDKKAPFSPFAIRSEAKVCRREWRVSLPAAVSPGFSTALRNASSWKRLASQCSRRFLATAGARTTSRRPAAVSSFT
jgi:hypothetical protein